jgi:hypothetical protein
VVTSVRLFARRLFRSEYRSPRSASAAVDCSSVSCAKRDRESSFCINACVRRRAAVTSEDAWATISSSASPLFCLRWRYVDEGVEAPDCRFEKRSSRSLSFARSALCFAVSWALRYCDLDL